MLVKKTKRKCKISHYKNCKTFKNQNQYSKEMYQPKQQKLTEQNKRSNFRLWYSVHIVRQ